MVVTGHGDFIYGMRIYLDRLSGRRREVEYLILIPFHSSIKTNSISEMAHRLNPGYSKDERWELAVTESPFKMVWDSEPARTANHAVQLMEGFLQTSNLSEGEKEKLVRDFLAILETRKSMEVLKWTEAKIGP